MLGAELEVAAGGPAEHLSGAPLEFRARGHVMPERGAGDEQRSLSAELDEIEGRHRPAGTAKQGQQSARSQGVEAALKGRFAHGIVDDVDTFAAGQTLDL